MVASPPNAWWWSPARGWTDYHAPLRSSGCTPDGDLRVTQDCGGGLVGAQRFHSITSDCTPSTMSAGCKPTFKLSIENFHLSRFECWKLKNLRFKSLFTRSTAHLVQAFTTRCQFEKYWFKICFFFVLCKLTLHRRLSGDSTLSTNHL